MTDIDQGPDPIDVLEHAMFDDFDPKFYAGDILVEGRAGTGLEQPSVTEIREGDPEDFDRCFIGEAVIKRIHDIPVLTYIAVAHAYNVSPHLVHVIGEGVVDLTFDEGVRFAKTAIKTYRADPQTYDREQYVGFANQKLMNASLDAFENDAAEGGRGAGATT